MWPIQMMLKAMRNGQHRNPNRQGGLFTKAYFHTPAELQDELHAAGFADIELLTIEGPWYCIPDFEEKWKDEQYRSILLETIKHMESDPSTIGFGGHIMGIGTKV